MLISTAKSTQFLRNRPCRPGRAFGALIIAGIVLVACETPSQVAAPTVSTYVPPPSPAASKTATFPGTDRFANANPAPVNKVARQPVSTFGADVDTASYAVVRRFLRDGVLPPRDAVRIEEMINYFPYDYAAPRDRTTPFATTVKLFPSPWSERGHLLHIGIKGYDTDVAERPRLNLVLLIDVSGSMDPPDRLPLLQQSLRLLAKSLRGGDRVSIVAYAGNVRIALMPTDGARHQSIVSAIDSLRAGGFTAGQRGIQLAYELAQKHFDPNGINRVVLATDGDFNVGMTDPAALKEFIAKKRKTGIYLTVLGVGVGNLNDNLMQTLAQAGNGTAAYIDSLQEARKVFVEETRSNLFPIADDLKIQVEFNPARISHYRLLGYETRALSRRDFGDDRVDAGDIGSGHSVTALYEVTLTGTPPSADTLRYAPARAVAVAASNTVGEYAHLRLRYKLPGEIRSRLIERVIDDEDRLAAFEQAPPDLRFAASVAAFGEVLRGTGAPGASLDHVERLADGARDRDTEGYRAELVQLIRLARSIRGR